MSRFVFTLSLLFISIMSYAQNFNIDTTWNNVNARERNGDWRNLKPRIDEIYAYAVKKKDDVNRIKALLYQEKIALMTADGVDAKQNTLARFDYEIRTVKSPLAKSILAIYQVRNYQEYLVSQYQTINERTVLDNAGDDFTLWTRKQFVDKIDELYQLALQSKKLLDKESVKKWSILISVDDQYVPTLYDVVMQDYINYLQGARVYIFGSEITEEHRQKAIVLRQELIDHYQTMNPDIALYNKYWLAKIQEPGRIAEEIEKLIEANPHLPFTETLYYLLSEEYYKRGNEYRQGYQSDKRVNYDKAIQIANRHKDITTNEKIKGLYETLLKAIYPRSIGVELEKYVMPNEPILAKVSHKNTDKIYYKLLEYPQFVDREKSKYYYQHAYGRVDRDSIYALIKANKVVKEGVLTLKNFDDFDTHETFVALEPVKVGEYMLLYSSRPFDGQLDFVDHMYAYTMFSASRYAVVYKDQVNIHVLDRKTGEPSVAGRVKVYHEQDGHLQYREDLLTNDNGVFLNKAIERKAIVIEIDEEPVKHYINRTYSYGQTESLEPRLQIFTDRAIYRPGQTVYYKFMAHEEEPRGKFQSITDESFTVHLLDADGHEIRKESYTTNEFGSFAGEFKLPIGVLNGQFRIKVEDYFYYFRVEEYKRPTFEVLIDDFKDKKRLGDEINIKGTAKSYAGANLSGARVTYSIQREDRSYIYRRGYSWHRPETIIIKSDTIDTDPSGKFAFDFVATSPVKKDKRQIDAFRYIISVVVTDINGETHTAVQSIILGDKDVQLDLLVSDEIRATSNEKIKIVSTNLNGHAIPVEGCVSIREIKKHDRVIESNKFYFGANFYHTLSEEEFISKFPNTLYDNAQDTKEKKGKEVLRSKFATDGKNYFELEIPKGLEGKYFIEAVYIDGQDSISTSKIVTMLPKFNTESEEKVSIMAVAEKESYQPGEIAKVSLSTSYDALVVMYNQDDQDTWKPIILFNKPQIIEIPITEAHWGGLGLNFWAVKYNSFITDGLSLEVPFKKSDLSITTSSIKEILTPGQPEHWVLTIQGEKGEKVASEILANMYDASLDYFVPHSFTINNQPSYRYRKYFNWERETFNLGRGLSISTPIVPQMGFRFQKVNFKDYGFHILRPSRYFGAYEEAVLHKQDVLNVVSSNMFMEEVVVTGYGSMKKESLTGSAALMSRSQSNDIEEVSVGDISVGDIKEESPETDFSNVQVRRNLSETAFFYPQLQTDKKGNVSFKFTAPESLTRWKFTALAHDKQLNVGKFETFVTTQKNLMITPNMPRFFREGDQVTLQARVDNMTDRSMNAKVKLLLFDAITMNPIDNAAFGISNNQQTVVIDATGSAALSWIVSIPKMSDAVTYHIVATSGTHSDAVESTIPVLTNRQLVTETMPISIREGQSKTYEIPRIKEANTGTHQAQNLTIEITANPIFQALYALPYFNEYPFENAESVFSRLFANIMAQSLVNQQPAIKSQFEKLQGEGKLTSKLNQNEELKALLMAETPWVRDVEKETERMQNIASLMDDNRMTYLISQGFEKLKEYQLKEGGFSWFNGNYANFNVTNYIVQGIGKIRHNTNIEHNLGLKRVGEKALSWLDKEFKRTGFNDQGKIDSYMATEYLLTKSYFLDNIIAEDRKQIDGVIDQLFEDKENFSIHQKARMLLILQRFGHHDQAKKLLHSLTETAVLSDEMGMYWNNNRSGWFWHEAPIETQALIIEAYNEIDEDEKATDLLKVWLLKNKQVNRWYSPKSTIMAVNALLNYGKEWVNSENVLNVTVGKEVANLAKSDQVGMGVSKTTWTGKDIKPSMHVVSIKKESPGVSWGGMYYQYFENLDKIKGANTNIVMTKELYVKQNDGTAKRLIPISENTPVKVGDLVTVRVTIKTDRAMEFVHLKDMRASGFEPTSTLSRYKYQQGFSYYESVKDASTNFFIDYLPQGSFVFEYELRANVAGVFSNGITSIQNLYAPEMSAHSAGTVVEIK